MSKTKFYDPFMDSSSAENKVIEYRERARKLLNRETDPMSGYMTWEITQTAAMLQLEELNK